MGSRCWREDRSHTLRLLQHQRLKGSVIGLSDLLNIELRNHNLQIFDNVWEGTLMAMEKETERTSWQVLTIDIWRSRLS